jgi:membrane-bound inhibitor of C-type lysozyme
MKTRLALVAITIAILCLSITPAFAQNVRIQSQTYILQPDGPGAGAEVAPLTPAQHQQLYQGLLDRRHAIASMKGGLALGPADAEELASSVRETKVAVASDSTDVQAPTPGSLYIGRNSIYNVVGDGQSLTAEPAIANSGAKWIGTQNWSRAYSLNSGSTWTAIPDDAGPSDAPLFCCDQDAVHDHGRDVTIYSILFINSAATTGAVRLYVRNAANTGNSCTYTIDPGAGTLLDYPHLGLGNNYLYLTANVISGSGTTWSGARVYRYNLDQVATCASATTNVITWTGSVGQVVWTPARSTTDTMYLVTIENTTQNRYFSWPESSTSMTSTVITVGSSNYGAATCKGGTSNSNWMQDTLSTASIGFQIRSALAQDHGVEYLATYYTVNANGASRPQAYSAGTIVQTSNMTLLNRADIFSTTTCFGFPDVAANSRGDLGISIAFGSSKTGGTAAQGYVGISDDYSRGSTRGSFGTVVLTASGNDNTIRYGDYLTTRVQEPVDTAFIASSYADQGGLPNVRFVEFMRQRYQQAYLDRGTK